MKPSPRVLLYDLETSHNITALFSLSHNDWVNPENIISERYIISASWKWLGEDKVHSVSVLDDSARFGKNPNDDTHVVKTLHKLMSEADCLVTHNGESFDNKYVKTRILYHGLDPLPPITSIDTCKVARNKFLFNSNKLDYVAKYLGLGGKVHTTPGLWLAALKGEKAAIKEMVTYNKVDVELLEKVFLKLRPYMDGHISRELFGGVGCPRCGSKKVQSRGYHRAITKTYQRFQCQACMGWFRLLKGETGSTKFRVI